MKSLIINRYHSFFFTIIISGSGFLFLYIFHDEHKYFQIVTLLTLFIVLSPFIFIKKIKKAFTKKSIVDVTGDVFDLQLKKLDTDEEVEHSQINFSDIKSYVIYFPNKDFVSIILKLYNKRKIEYSFLRRNEFTQDVNVDADELIKVIHKAFQNFNNKLETQSPITYEPSFLATQIGLYSIIGMCFGLLIDLFIIIGSNRRGQDYIQLALIAALIMNMIASRIKNLRVYADMTNCY